MDLIHKVLNIIVPPVILVFLLVFLPPYLVIRFLICIKRRVCPENVAGKAVLITGASSGIGEHLAYQYAKKGACLALVARREDRLKAVADKARHLGSPDVIVIPADVSKVEDCQRFVDETIHHFGQLDHLVNNAGVMDCRKFEDCNPISAVKILNTNFWGAVYVTHFAVPHLRKSKGKIIVISSVASWYPTPKLSLYNASKAALSSLYETLRVEFGSDIGITIVTPGIILSEMTNPESVSKIKKEFVPVESTEGCAKAILKSACRGDPYLTEPSWMRMVFLLKTVCPQLLDWFNGTSLDWMTSIKKDFKQKY